MQNNFNKKIEISTFLLQMQTLFIKYDFNQSNIKHIYKKIVTLGIPQNDQKEKISTTFNLIQTNNKFNEKMNVFVAPYWKYFCQFKSHNFNKNYPINPIKIYIPLKRENIEISIQKIFDFINENNIEHTSKLASDVRVDDLVIRVTKKEDADKIIDFINKNEELNLYNPNPFCITDGKVGLTMDRGLSYNDILSKYIFYYLKEATKSKTIASYEGLKYFLERSLYQLKSKIDISEQIKFFEQDELDNLPVMLQNLEEITSIIIKNLDFATKKDLYEEFDKINSEQYNEKQSQEYGKFDYIKMGAENNQLLKEIIETMVEKYGEISTKKNILLYRDTRDIGYITKTNDLRKKVAESKTFQTYINYIDLEQKINSLMPKKIELSEVKLSKESILEYICKETYIAFQTPEKLNSGTIQVASALIHMSNGNYNRITRTNNARMLAKENISPEEVKFLVEKILEANGYIIENEVDLYQLYATHIEYLCNNDKMKRGRK